MSLEVTLDTSKIVPKQFNTTELQIIPIIRPNEWKDKVPDISMGVGTARTGIMPDTDQKLIFFTGWNTDATLSSNRQLFVAEIDDDYNVTNIRKLLSPSDIGGDGISCADPVFIDALDKWVIFLTRYISGTGYDVGYVTFDKELQNIQDSYTSLISDTMDSGSPVALITKGSFLTTVLNSDKNKIMQYNIGDYTSLPLSATQVSTPLPYILWYGSPDVHDLFILNGKLGAVFENNIQYELWQIFVAFGTELPTSTIIDGTNPDYYYSGLLASMSPIPISTDKTQLAHVGHPHLSMIFKKPTLFFTWFRHWQLLQTDPTIVKRRFRHEIWALITDYSFWKPSNWLPLAGVIYNGTGGDSRIYYHPTGNKLVIIYSIDLGSATSVDITVKHATSYFDVKNSPVEEKTTVSSSGIGKIVIEDIGNYFQVNVGTGINNAIIWAIVK